MSILESVYRFILGCPFLRDGPVGVDYLGAHHRAYSVDAVPGTSIVKQFTDGSSQRQFLFVFASREPYGGSQRENLENAEFYEKLSEWLETQSRSRNLPEMDDGKEAISIEVLTGGYVLNTGTREARYQIQCKLNYLQEGL